MQFRNESYRDFTILCETPEQGVAYRNFVDEHYVTLACLERESELDFINSFSNNLFLKAIVLTPDDDEAINL
jgi:hypothetical protein